ncbi:MAG: hypothetical protein A3F18_01370 [Legionellales bacterium RIFCSPHIGHO2_12_FULL_37_14]|nr:MAG: hypothetical protein A3F18_01370 [Legionellales bacterium RIFCSPHIGHO2_12_FULL_37_14]
MTNGIFNKLRKKTAESNQLIKIQDMILYESANEDFLNVPNTLTRKSLPHFINELFLMLSEQHLANNYQKDSMGEYVIKENRENYVTRLLMPEFTLYTKDPLTLDEFHDLVKNIEKMAKTLKPNAHLLLSTLAVVDANGKLLDTAIYVEGGKSPILHIYTKNMADPNDVNYANEDAEDGIKEHRFELFSQQRVDNNPMGHSDFVAGLAGGSISHESVFEVSLLGGASYIQALDICSDHALGHSKALFKRRLENDFTELVPYQVEQCITSLGMIKIAESKLVEEPLLCDAIFLNIDQGDTGSEELVRKPAISDKYAVKVYPERDARTFTPELEALVEEHNIEVGKKFGLPR